jgi:quercetin dioxygenase-like cupin family protein
LTAPRSRREPVLVPAEGGERLDLGRSAPQVLLSGEMSRGRLSVLQVTQGSGGGPPLHVHSREDESFYVLGGSFVFDCGDTSWEGGRGAFVSLPAGVPHQYTAGAHGGTLLMMFTPSGMEEYFREWSYLVAGEWMTGSAMEELAAHHGLQLLQPYTPAAATPE